jgi:hypothetical protein
VTFALSLHLSITLQEDARHRFYHIHKSTLGQDKRVEVTNSAWPSSGFSGTTQNTVLDSAVLNLWRVLYSPRYILIQLTQTYRQNFRCFTSRLGSRLCKHATEQPRRKRMSRLADSLPTPLLHAQSKNERFCPARNRRRMIKQTRLIRQATNHAINGNKRGRL